MEFDQNFLLNCASIIATFLFLSAAGITIFRGLRLRWPVRVNCWFCNNDTKIYCSRMNWWKCPSCDQYNGFTKDGDYAHEIPEQSVQLPKLFAKLHPIHRKINGGDANKNLCERCNKNEELKMLELRMFEPKRFFSKGLEHFKKQLEVKYPLCDDCKILVQNVLRKQSLWLTRYKMLFYKQKSVSAVINNAKKLDKIIRVLLTMLTCGLVCCTNYRSLSFIGVFLQSSVFVINPAHRSFDALLTFLWICVSLGGPLNEIQLLELYEKNEWPCLENITRHHLATILTLIIGLGNITSRYRNTRHFKATFKKLESPSSNKQSFPEVDDGFSDLDFSDQFVESQTYSNYQQPVTKDRETRLSGDSPIERKCEDQQIAPTRLSSTDVRNDCSEAGSRHILKFDGNCEQYLLNESLSTLKTLSLGESRAGRKSTVPSIFRTKVYGSTSPDLFHRTIKSTRKFMLAPPKLKSFAQTSWVAGGYWQVGVDSPSLSRSSSQSSGFGSAGSNFGPSREPSVTKEIDKCSVISDNVQFFRPPRPSSANSLNSCCHHAAAMQSARCESPLYHQQLKITHNPGFLQNTSSHFSPVHPETNVCYERCMSLQNGNTNATTIHPSQSSSNNCSTVLNSTVWLTILLGGSLVFNIAIFCTIILR